MKQKTALIVMVFCAIYSGVALAVISWDPGKWFELTITGDQRTVTKIGTYSSVQSSSLASSISSAVASSSSSGASFLAKVACSPTQPPAWTDGWSEPENSSNCDYNMDGYRFASGSQLTNYTTPGRTNPGGSDMGNCQLANALWWGNHINTAPEDSDLSNPSGAETSALRTWWIKGSLHEGTTHFVGPPAGHEDILQGRQNFFTGLVIQDTTFTNADENLMVDIGTAADGYGNGPGNDYLCYTDNGQAITPGTQYVIYQGFKAGPPVPGELNEYGERYDDKNDGGGAKSYQMFHSNNAANTWLGEIWMIDMYYDNFGIGLTWFNNVGKVVVVETAKIPGNAGRFGWPGPLKTQYNNGSLTEMTQAKCNGTWDANYHGVGEGACVGPGMINDTNNDGTADFSFTWKGTQGDDPNIGGAVPVYFYTSIEAAIADGHTQPPFIEASCTGWATPPAGCDSTEYVRP